jgi:hypothetical protein
VLSHVSGSPRIRLITNKIRLPSCGAYAFKRLSGVRQCYRTSPALLGFGPCSNKLWTCHPAAPTHAGVPAIKAPYPLQAQAAPPSHFCFKPIALLIFILLFSNKKSAFFNKGYLK